MEIGTTQELKGRRLSRMPNRIWVKS
jgi:hypothetical protein